MNFFSGVEKEFNDLFGDIKDTENPEDAKLETNMDNLLSDIKSDLKNVPREDLVPGFSSRETEKDDRSTVEADEDGEFDADDARRAVQMGSKRKIEGKRCRVGDKTYAVGDRWTDEKNGKDMICILMNIPKEVQPKLAEADVTITPEKPVPVEEWNRPSVEPQWEYTAHPQKKPTQDKPCEEGGTRTEESKTEKKADEKEKKTPEVVEDLSKLTEQSSEIVNKDEPEESSTKITETSTEVEVLKTTENGEKPESKKEEPESFNLKQDSDKVPKEPEIIVVDPPKDGDDEEKADSGSDSEDEKPKRPQDEDEESGPEDEEKETREKESETIDDKSKPIEESSEMKATSEHDLKKTENLSDKYEELKVDAESTSTNGDRPPTANSESEIPQVEPPNAGDAPPQTVKGETLYTKETVIKRRKLYKTQETVETTETGKSRNTG